MNRLVKIDLPSGCLTLSLFQEIFALDEICAFATRQNPKRTFLFVSKVLGKHVPVSLKRARVVYKRLVQEIPNDVLGTVAWVGLAETATGFAEELAWCWAHYTNRQDAFFQITTRYPVPALHYSCFEEVHSHATFQAIHLPNRSDVQTLMLVDDEITTGNTLGQLMTLWKQHCPTLKRVVWVVLKSWLQPDVEKMHKARAAQLDIQLDIVALLKGSYSFQANPDFKIHFPANTEAASEAESSSYHRQLQLGLDGVRQGIRITPKRPESMVQAVSVSDIAYIRSQGEARVLGLGECTAAAFLLAEKFEEWGINSTVQSVTRSPILEGESIHHKQHWADPYGLNIAHYSYNVDAVACHSLHIVSECDYLDLPPKWEHAWVWYWNGHCLTRVSNRNLQAPSL
ncbi:MAG: phosphoribosyltransferase domain-containing protein [Pseudomonadota bacterium]